MDKITLGQVPELFTKIKDFITCLVERDYQEAMLYIDAQMMNAEKLEKLASRQGTITLPPHTYLQTIEMEYEVLGEKTLYYPTIFLYIDGVESRNALNMSALSIPGKPLEMILNDIGEL